MKRLGGCKVLRTMKTGRRAKIQAVNLYDVTRLKYL